MDFAQPLPEGMVALRKISPEQYPDFGAQPVDVARLDAAIDNSLKYLATPSSQRFYPYLDISHERAVASLHRLREIVDQSAAQGANPASPSAAYSSWFNQQIRDNFEVYQSIGGQNSDGSGFTNRVLFTGYFTPIYDASLQRTAEFQWPLYKLPDDLVRNAMTGEVSGRKLADGTTVPYYTRAEIESGKLAGDELVWLRSRWEAYIINVQGSARLRLADSGKIYEVGFAGTNGYAYTSPGKQMVADGVITSDQLSLKGLGDYFTAHPEMMDKYLDLNQRFVFFTERPGGPFGSLNVPVTPLGSIATDKDHGDIYPRAMPAFVNVPIPGAGGVGMLPFSGFLMDQDTGGAIRASGRCDIYMGVGPDAGAVAGHELQEGALYYLAIKPGLMGAGTQQATIGLPVHKAIVAASKGQTLELSINDLGQFYFDQEKGGNIPADVQKLDGARFRTTGLMMPVEQTKQLTSFALVENLDHTPPIEEMMVVTLPPGKSIDYSPDEVTVEGILHVREQRDGGIFALDATAIKIGDN